MKEKLIEIFVRMMNLSIYIYLMTNFIYLFLIFYNIKKKLNIFNSRNFFSTIVFSFSYLLLLRKISIHIPFITVFINLAILAINFFITLRLLFFQLVCKSIHKCFYDFLYSSRIGLIT